MKIRKTAETEIGFLSRMVGRVINRNDVANCLKISENAAFNRLNEWRLDDIVKPLGRSCNSPGEMFNYLVLRGPIR